MTGCVIVAAGKGTRFKSKIPKPFFLLRDSPILEYSLRTFSDCNSVDEIVLVIQRRFLTSKWVSNLRRHFPKISAVVEGGRFREESVYNGFLKCSRDCGVILIHDGARPFVSCRLIHRVVKTVLKYGSCIPIYPINGSVKLVKNRRLVKTLNEKEIVVAQTPQGFTREVLEKIFSAHKENLGNYQDESSMCESSGLPVHIITGEVTNIKITTRQDLKIAFALLKS